MHEAKMHDSCAFVTLTYDTGDLPTGFCGCRKGHVSGSLCVDDVQKFLKRLRERVAPVKLRFFLCGEYGEKLGRPHYHAVIFGYDFPDKVQVSDNGQYSLYTSALLSDTWGKGYASIGQVTFESAAYVASYSTKKITGKGSAAHYQGKRPEFLIMSRRPGIGRSWIDKFQSDVYPSDEVIVRGHSSKPPRYYDSVLEAKDPLLLQQLKERREAEGDKPEMVRLKCGFVGEVTPSRNARRLAVREKVARAKFALKRRNMESE